MILDALGCSSWIFKSVKTSGLFDAGSSCTDHSGMGDRLALDGHTSIPKLCWIAQRRLLQEAMVMVENVASFPEGQLIEYLGDIYYIETIKLCSSAYWIQRRLRKSILLTHKAKCKRGMVSLEEWLRPLGRSLHLTWYDVLTSTWLSCKQSCRGHLPGRSSNRWRMQLRTNHLSLISSMTRRNSTCSHIGH